jgi:hypothetical protein
MVYIRSLNLHYDLAFLAITTTIRNRTRLGSVSLSTLPCLIRIFLLDRNLLTVVLCSFSLGLCELRLNTDIGDLCIQREGVERAYP